MLKPKLHFSSSKTAHSKNVDEITICWPNGLDFSPDVLYEVGKNIEKKTKKILGLSKRKNGVRSVPAQPKKRIAGNHKH
jgi:hypothetical protein